MKEMEESLALFKNPFECFWRGHCYIQSTVFGNLPHHLSEDQKCPFLHKEQGLILRNVSFFCFDASPGLLPWFITNLLFTWLWWGWDVALSRAVLFIAKLASIPADWILLNPFFWHWREHRTVLTPVWEQRVRFYWHHSPAEDWRVTNLSLERTTGFWRPLWPQQSATDNRRTFALMSVDNGSVIIDEREECVLASLYFLQKLRRQWNPWLLLCLQLHFHNSKM